jgi:hypothetical protein
VEVDPKDNFRIGHIVPVRLNRPHGLDFEGDAIWCLCIHEGRMYYSDAGIAPPGKPSGSPTSGYICRIDL